MAGNYNKDEKDSQLTNAVYDVSCSNHSVIIKGWVDLSIIDEYGDIKSLTLKKRGSKLSYSVPFEWLDNGHWKANINLKNYNIYKGTWDFYFKYEDKSLRIKVERNIPDEAKLIYELDSESLLLNVYKTIKDSLSIKSSIATIQMENLVTTKNTDDKGIINIYGLINDSLMSGFKSGSEAALVLKQRNSHELTKFPVALKPSQDKYEMFINFNYKKLIRFEDLYKQTWDCYLLLFINEENHLVRITWQETSSLKDNSRMQFETPYIYEFYFYMTINNNLSAKLTDLPIKRDVQNISFDDNMLALKGHAYLDIQNEDVNERYLVFKGRESSEELVCILKEENDKGRGNFNIKVPLNKFAKLEIKEKEVFDLYIRFYHKNQIYERKLGCEEYTYFKDSFIDSAILKNKKITKYYISFTPGGNLKIETYMLSIMAYLYMRYFKDVDRLLHKDKDIWLVGERYNTAQDTGYHFFKYCRQNHPELNVYYVIDRHSKDVSNIKDLGNVVYLGTLKHARLSALANTFIGSHDIDYFLALKGRDLDNYKNGKRVFLQHGVLGRKNAEYNKIYYKYPFHLFCVSSKSEMKLVQEKMNYDSSEVKVTGLSRFDHLLSEHDTENTILLIPTWRDWIADHKRLKGSLYFNKYKSLLNNPELHKILEQYNMKLNFYPHYRMQPYMNEFKKLTTERVSIVELGGKNVQDLLMESKLMITDYSSVSFDFNYMSKPVIFYHFDLATFFKNGILRPIEETFLGDICTSEEDVIRSLEGYINNNFHEKDSIAEKKKVIFSKIDRKNNERIFRQIKKL